MATRDPLLVPALALALNAFVLPGTGSLVLGRRGEGIAQIVLVVAGFLLVLSAVVFGAFGLVFAVVGVVVSLGAWVWGVVTGVRAVAAASAA